MSIDSKKLRILFVDDEPVPMVRSLRSQGFNIEKVEDVENLDNICDGRYHVIFFDVLGVGNAIGGSGFNILEYVAKHNPMIFKILYTAKPIVGDEGEYIRKYANRVVRKDAPAHEVIEILQEHAKQISPDWILAEFEKHSRTKLGIFERRKFIKGTRFDQAEISDLAKRSGIGADSIKIAANLTGIASTLFTIVSAL